ncbi:sensor histidine kinase [Fusobacterium sp. PH5-44]|uniref:sensor histidine kinase n=1 Tax=unclassified Fusobacterium TaxID=2648384 RepID=UPI003D1B8061
MKQNITFKIHKTELILGIFMVIISILLPNFILSNNFTIYDYVEKSIHHWDKEYLLYAVFHLVFFNTLRAFPIFFSVFLLMAAVDIFVNGKENNVLKIIIGFIIIQFLYFLIYKIYFDMGYYFGKVAILEMIYIAFYSNNQFKKISLVRRNSILFLVFIGIQWLDITQYFSALDYKTTGELFFDLKTIAILMEADNLLNLIGFLFFILFTTFSIALLLIFFDQEHKKKLYEKEVEINNLKIQELENRYLKETQYLVHDLKTPLFSIGTLVQILDMQEENQKKKNYYQRIEKSLERCNIMISEILRGSYKNPITTEKVFTFIQSYLSTHKCVQFLNYQNNCPKRKIKVNKIAFSRAIINLIINSYEALEEDGEIQLIIKGTKRKILIKILDNGKGMTHDELENAFNHGFSNKNSNGMGLTFVKAVMEEHGCKIYIANRKTNGVKVYIVMSGEVVSNEK